MPLFPDLLSLESAPRCFSFPRLWTLGCPKFPWPCYFEYLVGLHSFGQPLFSWMMDRTSLSNFVLLLLLKVPTSVGTLLSCEEVMYDEAGGAGEATHDGADEASLLQNFFEDM